MNQSAQKVTPRRARAHNSHLVLKTIYHSGEISRAEIARVTRLTRPTVSDVVAGLMDEGLVAEVGRAPSTGGKRAVLLSVVDDSRHLIGIDLSREDFRGAVINLRGEVRRRVSLPLEGRDGDAALVLVYSLVEALVEADESPLLGLGIGAPGLVDSANGVMHQAVNLNWRDVPLRGLLQERYGLPVYAANDCQVAALAEYTFGDGGDGSVCDSTVDAQDLAVINVGWGVGAGIVLGGQLLHGNPFGAGEIGHVTIVEGGERCRCGNRGCLETVTSNRAIVRQARAIARQDSDSLLHRFAASPDVVTFDVVLEAFEAGDRAVRELVSGVGRSLGIAAANLVGVLGGCRILISGQVAGFGRFLLDAIRQEITRRSLPLLAEKTEVGFASLGTDIVLLGASALLLSHELGVF